MGTVVAGFLLFLGIIFFLGAAVLTFTTSIVGGIVLAVLGLIFIWGGQKHAESTRDNIRRQLDQYRQ